MVNMVDIIEKEKKKLNNVRYVKGVEEDEKRSS